MYKKFSKDYEYFSIANRVTQIIYERDRGLLMCMKAVDDVIKLFRKPRNVLC